MKSSFAIVLALLAHVPLFAMKLSDLPQSDSIKVGEVTAQLSPATSARIEIPFPAKVTLRFSGMSASFKKGEQWGVCDGERIAIENERIALAKRVLARREKGDAENAMRREEVAARLREVEASILALSESDDAPLLEIEGGAKLREQYRARAAEGRAALVRSRDILRDKLASFNDEHADDVAERKSALALREIEAAKLAGMANLTMPCDGVVSLLAAPDSPGVVTPRPGVAFAVVEDRSRYLIRLPVGGFWRTLPAANLRAVIRTASGSEVSGRFVSSESVKVMGRDQTFYVFEVAAADLSTVSAMNAGDATAEIVFRPGRRVRLIPMVQFAAEHPEAFKGRADFRTAVSRVFPECEFVAQGVSEVAVATRAEATAPEANRKI